MKIEATTTAISKEPIDLEQLKNQLRLPVGETREDALLSGYITAARERVENIINWKLRKQRFYLYLDDWPVNREIEIPYMPYTTTPTTGIIYKNSASDTTTFPSTNWVLDVNSLLSKPTQPGRIVLDNDKDWPTGELHDVNPIRVEFGVGYAKTTNIPENITLAIKLIAGSWYENRENTIVVAPGESLQQIPNAANALLAPYRNFKFPL